MAVEHMAFYGIRGNESRLVILLINKAVRSQLYATYSNRAIKYWISTQLLFEDTTAMIQG